jgi:hypothetical protein
MNRKYFDDFATRSIDDLHPIKESRGMELIMDFMESLDETGQQDLIEDYKKFAQQKRDSLRDLAQTMVALCQLRELEPTLFGEKSHVETVLNRLELDLNDSALASLNSDAFITMLYEAREAIHARSSRTARPPAKQPMPPRRGDKGR